MLSREQIPIHGQTQRSLRILRESHVDSLDSAPTEATEDEPPECEGCGKAGSPLVEVEYNQMKLCPTCRHGMEATEDEPVFDDGMDDDEPECECLGVHSSLCPVWQRRIEARGMEMMLEWQQSKKGMFEPSKAFIAAHRAGKDEDQSDPEAPVTEDVSASAPAVSSPISREQAERAKALKADIVETRKSLSKNDVVGVPYTRCLDWEAQIDAIIEAHRAGKDEA